jgi:hydroxymethylglutaryl-CoA synthase
MSERDLLLSGFHRKTQLERAQVLKALFPDLDDTLSSGGLDTRTADLMIENCIGLLTLPVGLGLHLTVNNKLHIVPMCVEEPSIIAAACSACKLITESGGFTALSTHPIMRGQIQLTEVDASLATYKILQKKKYLIEKANSEYCHRMAARGGGVENLDCKVLAPDIAVVEVFVNVCDAMGANLINSLCERMTQDVLQIAGQGSAGLRILSNYCTERRVMSQFKVHIKKLATKGIDGLTMAKKIIEAYKFADLDVYRAVTHNKGIMNGIDAIALATGQDFRAIEAAAHAWASRSGAYKPLTSYWLEGSKFLCARIELPLSIGVHGGVLKTNKVYQGNLYLLGNPSSKELAQVMASVGLSCNFAAIRAMVSEGIQKGHMGLHARNIAISAGVPNELVQEVVEYMKQRNDISEQAAKDYLAAHNFSVATMVRPRFYGSLSTFSIHISDINPPVKLDIAFESIGIPIHLAIDKQTRPLTGQAGEIHDKFMGAKRGYEWTMNFWNLLDRVRFEPDLPRTNIIIRSKLKLLAIWMNILSFKLIQNWNLEMASKFIQMIIQGKDEQLFSQLRGSDNIPSIVVYPICLLREIWHIFDFHLQEWKSSLVPNSGDLAKSIVQELEAVILSNINCHIASQESKLTFHQFLDCKSKQMCATLMYLCDYLGAAEIDPVFIQQLKVLGRILECLSSALRDLSKFVKDDIEPTNIYKYWVSKNDSNPQKYLEDVVSYITPWRDQLNEKHQQIVRLALKVLEEYYTNNPKL